MSAWSLLHWRYCVAQPPDEETRSKFWRQFKRLPDRHRINTLELHFLRGVVSTDADWAALDEVRSLKLMGRVVRRDTYPLLFKPPLHQLPLLEQLCVEAGYLHPAEGRCFDVSALRQHQRLRAVRVSCNVTENLFPYREVTELHLEGSVGNSTGMPMLTDLTPLACSHLQVCTIDGASRLLDVTPLAECKSLVTVTLLHCHGLCCWFLRFVLSASLGYGLIFPLDVACFGMCTSPPHTLARAPFKHHTSAFSCEFASMLTISISVQRVTRAQFALLHSPEIETDLQGISNVSPLGGLQRLTIVDCANVQDVGGLGAVERLTLYALLFVFMF